MNILSDRDCNFQVHLFDIDVPGKITFKESEILSPGNQFTIFKTRKKFLVSFFFFFFNFFLYAECNNLEITKTYHEVLNAMSVSLFAFQRF